MKYSQLLSNNIVPEWRNQYINYRDLNSALEKAIESKALEYNGDAHDKYQKLIRFDQSFAEFFLEKCTIELEKIESFHNEKLEEMKGKYQNLKYQLDDILYSPMYKEIQEEVVPIKNSFVTKLFQSIKTMRAKISEHKIKENFAESSKELQSETCQNADKLFAFKPLTICADSKDQKIQIDVIDPFNRNFQNLNIKTLEDSIPQKVWTSCNEKPKNNSINRINFTKKYSKNFLVKSYKKKISHLNFAYKEFYYSLVLFEQYTQLNYAGFEQILRKHDRMFASNVGRKFFDENIQVSQFYKNLRQIDFLIEGVEHLFTLHFVNGNRRKAIEKLQVPQSRQESQILNFRIGLELGILIVLFALVLTAGYSSDTAYDWRTVFRLFRSPLLLIIFLFQTGISLVIWKHYKINHVLIFELNPRDNLSYHHFIEFGSILGIIWSISVLVFIYSDELGIKPSLCPLFVILLIAFYLFNPTQTLKYRARYWLLKRLARIFSAPFHPVKFSDFWIADQLVSIVPFFLDLEFLSCFYTTDDVLSVTHLDKSHANRCVTRNTQDLVIRTFVAAFPAWTRLAQCLRRWKDENWRTHHLCNAMKYFFMVTVIFLSSIAQYEKTCFTLDAKTTIWLASAIFTSALTAYWDIIYDFGLFNTYSNKDKIDIKREGNSEDSKENSCYGKTSYKQKQDIDAKRFPFLRDQLVYPVWVYYFAIIEDTILRFGWVITISLTEFSGIEAGLVVSLLAPIEMFRRFVWNCIRLENEQINNCGLFREVRDIPIEVVAPIDESHVKKVIAMMDSKDGVLLRNKRMMKRRTLRSDIITYMEVEDDSLYDLTRHLDVNLT